MGYYTYHYNRYYLMILILGMSSLLACSGKPIKTKVLGLPITFGEEVKKAPKKDDPPVQKIEPPTQVDISFFASNKLNLSPSGKATPVEVRIYELTSFRIFENTDFFELYDNAESILGRSLVAQDAIKIDPHKPPLSYSKKLHKETAYIGFLVAYRNPDTANWRALTGKIEPEKITRLAVLLDADTISLTKMQENVPQNAHNAQGIDIQKAQGQLDKTNKAVRDVDKTHKQIKSLEKSIQNF